MTINIKDIYDCVIECSDIELQKKIWLNQNNDTEEVSSYIELMCSLFDDNNFDFFIDQIVYYLDIPINLINELNKLRDLLNNYKEKESDEKIIEDPNWKIITDQAKSVIIL